MKRTGVSDSLRVLRCGLAGETYALDMTWVRGIQRADRLRPYPERADSVGKLSGRSGDVPVFDLADLLGRGPLRAGPNQQVVVLSDAPRTWGLLVERVSPVTQVAADQVHPLPTLAVGAAAPPLRGVLRVGTELLPLLTPARLHPEAPPAGEEDSVPLRRPGGHPAAALPFRRGTKNAQGRIVLFAASDPRPLLFGISLARALEVLDLPPVVPVPGGPQDVLGLVNWRDRPIGVLDLARHLGLPGSAIGPHSRLLIVRAARGSEAVGVVVRPTVRILRLPLPHRPSLRELPFDSSRTKAVVELKRETLVIPDLRRLGEVAALAAR
jgi:purine-binding chemotaxis protein CheW